MKDDIKLITNFYARFTVCQLDEETQVLRSQDKQYLLKNIRLEEENADLEDVVETLEQHLTLSDQFLLTLQHYDIQTYEGSIHIRSIYQYSHPSLKQEIALRKEKLMYFHSSELWMVMYNIVRALEYLEKLNIGYGVLGCDKIFLGERVKLLDPSAIAEDPLQVTNNRLHSPEILLEYSDVDILKSDVFIFGLCILQASLLIDFTPEFGRRIDETRLRIYLQSVDEMYEPQLGQMLRLMLEFNPNDRPTFSQIKDYLERTLDLANAKDEDFNAALAPDIQDQPNAFFAIQQTNQYQNIDMQAQEISPNQSGNMSEFQRAKMRFLSESSFDNSLSQISQKSQRSSITLEKAANNQKKRVSKSIKDKLVKKMNSHDLQIIQVNQYGKENLFTHPKLMADIQNQLQSIARNRNNARSKENIQRNY